MLQVPRGHPHPLACGLFHFKTRKGHQIPLKLWSLICLHH
jgi:hypothetical protein